MTKKLEQMSTKNNLIISSAELLEFLLGDDRCIKEQRAEVLITITNIDNTAGRKWVFSHDWKEYIIDEYNEHNDFIKSYTFRL
jgi:hypothetical protein